MRIKQIQAILYRVSDEAILYLLLKRNPKKGGFWQPVTGGVEPGEDASEALSREIDEELGISTVEYITPLIYEFSFTTDLGSNRMEEVYGVKVSEDQRITLSPEHVDYAWLPHTEALSKLKWKSNKIALRHLDDYLKFNKSS